MKIRKTGMKCTMVIAFLNLESDVFTFHSSCVMSTVLQLDENFEVEDGETGVQRNLANEVFCSGSWEGSLSDGSYTIPK